MEGYFWLLLQNLPLIATAAALFFILGWRWRGLGQQRQHLSQEQQIDSENAAARLARDERDASRAMEEKLRAKLAESQAELQEANDHQTLLQKEVLRLSDALKLASEAAPRAAPLPPVPQNADLLEEKAALEKARQELGAERSAFEQLKQAALPPLSPTPASASGSSPKSNKRRSSKK